MAFLHERLSTRIERLATSGKVNRGRRKDYSTAGRLAQTFEAQYPVHEFTIGHGMLSPDAADEIRNLWYVVNFTPYEGFLFRDWRDYVGTQSGTALLNTSANLWQLRRKYTFGSVSVYRNITKPVAGTVAILEAGGSPCTFTLDTTTGIATVTAGTPSYWTGQFDVPVTFEDDSFIETLDSSLANLALQMPQIKLEEIL